MTKYTPAPWFYGTGRADPMFYTCGKVPLPNTKSNLQLMTSAPEMLEALKASKAVLLSILGTTYEHEIIKEQVGIIEKAIAKAEGNLFWTFELDGEIYDGDFDSRDEADNHAQEKYAEDCQEESPRNGETFERDDYALIEYSYDDDGERVVYNREDAVLEYEHYHGDAKEHGYP